MSTKVLVLGIDALDPDYFDRHRAELPHLSALAVRGGHGRLRSTIPPLTGPAWTTAFSGMNPAKTGIAAFTSADLSAQVTVLDSRDVRVPRVWNVLSAQDRRCAVIGVPMAYPVEEIDGMMVGGFMTPSTDVPFTFPTSLQDELVVNGYLPSMGLKGDTRNQRRYLDKLQASARIKYDYALAWLANDAWDCFMLVLSEPDWLQHYLARPEGHPEQGSNETEMLRFFQFVDRYVGEWAAAAGPGSHVLVCSDHGFGHFILHNVQVNRYLIDEGYLRLKNGSGMSPRNLIASRMRDAGRLPGWQTVRRLLPGRLKRAGLALSRGIGAEVDEEQSVALFRHRNWFVGTVELRREAFANDSAFRAMRQELLEKLRALRDPRSGVRVFREVHLREEVFHGPYAGAEPEIIGLFAQGYGGVDAAGSQLVADIPLTGVSGGLHRQDGVWMLAGPEVQAGAKANLDLQDVAPIIYHLLGVKIPGEMDGRVPYDLFSVTSELHRRRCPTADFRHLERAFVLPQEEDAAAEELVLDRLRGLGYVE